MTDTLPAPRLQLRWRAATKRELARDSVVHHGVNRWTCVYELILPLNEGDIRRKKNSNELALEICRTFTSTDGKQPDYEPFRDGAHAQWDSSALGDIPIFVIAPDGSAKQQPNRLTSGER